MADCKNSIREFICAKRKIAELENKIHIQTPPEKRDGTSDFVYTRNGGKIEAFNEVLSILESLK